jgi:glycosyltransferase involved in cell wall biosynthesis
MKVAYVVSRFPHVSETFIVREIDAVAATGEVEVEILSLFPPVSETVHPIARPWLRRLYRPGAGAAAAGFGWWLARRPLRLLGSCAVVVAAYAHRPRLLARALATLPIAAAQARRLRGGEIERLHAHYATYPALCAWLCRRLTGIPYSFTVHAHDLYVDQSLLARKVAEADFVVAISEYNRRFLADYGGGSTTPVEVVHCGIDPAAFEFRPRPPASAGPVPAACVASLQEYKGHAVLLDALAGDDDGPLSRLRLDLVGDGPLRGELEARAAALGLAERVRFHGSLPEERVREVLAAANLFVLPSIVARDGQMEGLPVSIMEALASGLLVVSTRLSGIPELVRDGETGLLAEPGDAADLRRVLTAAVAGTSVDPAAGRREIEREYDIADTARRMVELLQGALTTTS